MFCSANLSIFKNLIIFAIQSKIDQNLYFDCICLSEQTSSTLRIWSYLLYRANLIKICVLIAFQPRLTWANVFNTMNLIIFAIQSKLCQYEEFASSYQPMQTSSILWVWIPLLTQVNTSNFRFWTHFQPFVSLLVTVSLRVFTSEANVVQKSKNAH